MIGLDQILNKCSEGITAGCTIAWHHVGYVIHYKENIQKLHEETKKLENELTRIDGRVERAKNDGEIPEDDVLQWIKSANGIKVDVEAFQDGARENKWCFKWCPNVYRRYKLGKDSEEKIARAISIKEEGEKYMTLEVANRAPPLEFGYNFSQGYDAFDSRAEIFENIMKALADPCIKMIGLYGPGGVGKTTMATEVGKLAKQNGLFDDVAMATISQTLNEKAVKEKLALQLGLTLDGSAYQLYHRLNNGKKNLVILDDVWKPLNLADIEIPITDGNKGCKVVITSRKRGLCQKMSVPVDQEDSLNAVLAEPEAWTKEFLMGVLREPEAWTLFKKVAAISVDSEIPSEAKEVCDKCGGLPIAIRAVAAALKGKGKHAWKDALRQLKKYKIKEIPDIDPNLLISLKWSYDRLEPKDARSCFLLCSLFPEDAEISINELVRYSIGMRLLDQDLDTFDEVRDRVLLMVDVLKTSCLLLDDDTDESVVKMHDIIRDVAISIAEDEKRYLVKHGIEKWPVKGRYEHYSAISLRFTANIHEFPNELECRGLHTLVLACSNYSPTDFPNNFFNGMENNLEVLDLSEMPIKSLPSSLSTLVKLRMLCLNGGRLMTEIALLGILGSLRNLEILSLTGMKKVLSHGEDGTGFSELQFLKSQPQIPPGSFCNLCELRVKNCQFKFLFTHSIARGLEQLQCLEIRNCEDMEEIIRNERQGDEEEIIFHHLKKMVLNDLPNLRSFYLSMKNISTTEANNSNPSRPLFCEKVAFPALEGLTIEYIGNISGIIGDKQLKLPVQQEEHESFWSLPRLRDLRIVRCSELKAIVVANKEGGAHDKPLIFRELCSLHLGGLENLKSFYSIGGSKAEEEISKPQPLFNEKVAFPALEGLTINDVGNISGIIGDKQLKLPVRQEENESFWNLLRLRDLRIANCSKLKAIVVANKEGGAHDKPLIFRELCSLHLRVLENLKSFYSIGGSKAEEEIFKPQPLFNEKVAFPALEDLTIGFVENISGIIGDKQLKLPVQQEENESLWNLSRLRHLSVYGCSKLKAIVVANTEGEAHDKPLIFRDLHSLHLSKLDNLKSFYNICGSRAEEEISKPQLIFNEKVVFPCLEKLIIWGMNNIKPIWIRTPPTNSFNKLTSLDVALCNKLPYVAPLELLGNLQNLQSIKIRNCESIEEVFKARGSNAGEGTVSRDEATSEQVEIISVPPQLERVYLTGLPCLISFCSGYKLPPSVQLSIQECPSFRPLM